MTHPINDFIPLDVIRIGNVEIAFTREPRGVMIGRPFLLDKSKPIYLAFERKVWKYFIDR